MCSATTIRADKNGHGHGINHRNCSASTHDASRRTCANSCPDFHDGQPVLV